MSAVRYPIAPNAEAALSAPLGRAARASEAGLVAGADVVFATEAVGPAFPSREAHDQAWKDFSADPDWQAAKAETEKNGKLVDKVESVFMTATDYSPVK